MTKRIKTISAERAVITTLTPEAAQRLLANNTFNRPLRARRIQRIAKAITEGRWKFNGATIVVDKSGRLLDGQHRCHAVVSADTGIRTVLVTGVLPSVFDTIDQGAKRTGNDVFHLCGVTHPQIVSSSLTYVWQNRAGITEGTEGGSRGPDMDERISLFDSLPGYEGIVADVCRYQKFMSKLYPLPLLAGMYFLFQEKHKQAAQRFLTGFAGVHEEDSMKNPARLVREVFIDLQEQDYRIGRQAKAAYLKLAWNAFVSGQEVTEIQLLPTLDIPINRLTSQHWLESTRMVA